MRWKGKQLLCSAQAFNPQFLAGLSLSTVSGQLLRESCGSLLLTEC